MCDNIYYSQNNQDKYLEEEIYKGYKNGFFVDVGAHDGISINNTLYFEKNNNWTGINIEPISEVYNKLVINRPNCINLECAITNNEGEEKFMRVSGYSEMISGLVNDYDYRHMVRLNNEISEKGGNIDIVNVKTYKLESIFDKYNITNINFLSIDVEGAEFNVIKSINFNKVFIDVIIFENNYKDISIEIIKYLKQKGYYMLCSENETDIIVIHKFSKFCPPLAIQ
jgi:FkbM family methyltransferase